MNYAMHVVSCSQPLFAPVLCLRIESARVYLYLYWYLYLTFNLYAAIILMMVIPSTVPCSTLYSLPSTLIPSTPRQRSVLRVSCHIRQMESLC